MSEQDSYTKTTEVPQTTSRQRIAFLVRFVSQPLLFFVVGVGLLALLGLAQRTGWILPATTASGNTEAATADVDYICPMMCTPAQKEPGRCPVCAMELVPASGGTVSGDERSVIVDPATRRVVNIRTVSVRRAPLQRTIVAVGEVGYDETRMKTISAYANGRFDKMYVNATGAVVKQGDVMAEFYSPDLYSAQVEYLQAREVAAKRGPIAAVNDANRRLQTSSRQRLVELGMTESQIERLTRDGEALSRLDVVAPMQGTVIERLTVEGEYVEEGQPVFRLADLSTVWLLLELFPADAAIIREGQIVQATLKSMPGRTFPGQVSFIEPEVKRQSRTVTVRVALDNKQGLIRVGDFAKATIETQFEGDAVTQTHPLVVPRSAVLSAANESVVYAETETGRFEIRRVTTGPSSGDNVVIIKGLAEGEKVATTGNFLLDSQMQLAGNPSLIDPALAAPPLEMIAGFSAKELAEIQQLPDAEQPLAIAQVICPVSELKLGSMGVPPKVEVDGRTIFICCEGCREDVMQNPAGNLGKIERYNARGPVEIENNGFEVPEIGEIQLID